MPVAVRSTEGAPSCCGQRMAWIPQVGAMDAKEPSFQSTVYVRQPDGTEKPVVVGSLSQMRRIERQSEQAARNGEGQQMVWRDFSNDRNHSDRHSFAADPSVQPEKSSRVKVRAVDAEVGEGAAYGPGVDDHNTSALVSE